MFFLNLFRWLRTHVFKAKPYVHPLVGKRAVVADTINNRNNAYWLASIGKTGVFVSVSEYPSERGEVDTFVTFLRDETAMPDQDIVVSRFELIS